MYVYHVLVGWEGEGLGLYIPIGGRSVPPIYPFVKLLGLVLMLVMLSVARFNKPGPRPMLMMSME
jgi:hypothetical protein